MMKRLNSLRKAYEETDIPDELQSVVQQAVRDGKRARDKRARVSKSLLVVAAAFLLFIGSINASPALAKNLSAVPLLGKVVSVFTVNRVAMNEPTYEATIETPAIEGLDDSLLQQSINEKYVAENKRLFERFEQRMEQMEEKGGGHLGVDAGYEVVTNTSELLSIRRFETETMASSATTVSFDTIDKQQEILLTLPSLFVDDRYIEKINDYLLKEMKRQMQENEANSYFLDEEEHFQTIEANQSFYITADHKLVIAFNEYEVAPGAMGTPTFEIPTHIIKDLLVSDHYIR